MIKAVAVLLILTSLVAPCEAGRFSTVIANAAATTRPNGPAPQPVGSKCDNCDGVGKVGDGTIMKTCPVCNGTGKKPLVSAKGQWIWSEVEGKWVRNPAMAMGTNAQPRGHYEDRTVCNGRTCSAVRVFVRD